MAADEEFHAPTPEELAAAAPAVPLFRTVPVRPAWRPVWDENEEAVHVVPSSDVVVHEAAEDCVCGPSSRIDQTHGECDHPDIWIHQHHALDGRVPPHLR